MKLTIVLCLVLCLWTLGSEGGKDKITKEDWRDIRRVGRCIWQNLKKTVKNMNVDVVEVMDHSSSLDHTDYNQGVFALKEINKIIDSMSLPPGIQGGNPPLGSRIGYVKFSQPDETSSVIHLDEENDLVDINTEIGDIDFDYGARTAMTTGLELADVQFVTDTEWWLTRNKRVWLVTDGKNNEGGDPVLAAATMKSWEVHVCVVAIGNANIPKLNQVASPGYNGKPCVCDPPTYRIFKLAAQWAAGKMKKVMRKKSANMENWTTG